MDIHRIGAPAVRSAASRSRRLSLIGLGGAAIAAVARPVPARAGKGGKKAKKKCTRQVGACETAVRNACGLLLLEEEAEACEAALLPCCASFKGCKAGTAYECLLNAVREPEPE
jgi:hypothetical protein